MIFVWLDSCGTVSCFVTDFFAEKLDELPI